MTLMKSVFVVSPLHSMQIFLWSKHLTIKVDGLTRDLFWGFKPNDGLHLYLKAWSSLCSPRSGGGLRFRKFHLINKAFIMNLGWSVVTYQNNVWVKLVKAKYLRWRRLLDLENIPNNASWIIQGIWKARSWLSTNICYKIGCKSDLDIFLDPWIPYMEGFKPPRPNSWSHSIFKVHDLMCCNYSTWDVPLIQVSFPSTIKDCILSI